MWCWSSSLPRRLLGMLASGFDPRSRLLWVWLTHLAEHVGSTPARLWRGWMACSIEWAGSNPARILRHGCW